MTSASELFYNRRSRVGRNSDLFEESGFESPTSSDRASNRRHRISGVISHTRHQEACDPVRRAVLSQRQPTTLQRSHLFLERDSVLLEGGGHQLSLVNVANERDRMRSTGGDRLPRSVLLARERLLQRLSGVSLSGPRRNNRSSTSNPHNEIAYGQHLRLVEAGDWEMELSRDFPASIVLLTQATSKRPQGLTKEVIDHLPKAVFTNVCSQEHGDEPNTSKLLKECSICLETFSNGDELISLQCGHSYHVSCLVPWISTCGDCPYCRRKIVQ